MSDSLQPYGLLAGRLQCSWDFVGKNTGMHCHFLLQILHANYSILPDGLCNHSHIPSLHMVCSHGHPELPQSLSPDVEFVEGPWKEVTG